MRTGLRWEDVYRMVRHRIHQTRASQKTIHRLAARNAADDAHSPSASAREATKNDLHLRLSPEIQQCLTERLRLYPKRPDAIESIGVG